MIHTSETDAVPHAPVSLRDAHVVAPGGYADPGEAIVLHLPLFNCYNTEDDLVLPTTAYDGLALRITDLTPGRSLRSVLVEAFASEFTTGDDEHYPKHLPRSSNTAYFQDMSVWAGNSGGIKHVRLRLPGMAGSAAQLRFEYTQDLAFTCQDLRPGTACGVFVDNVVIKSVVTKKVEPVRKRTK
jgi:hypothetical protein